MPSSWWPKASLSSLKAATYYTTWVFAWDDKFDQASLGISGPTEYDRSTQMRHRALKHVTHHLGLSDSDIASLPPSSYSKIFADAGELFRKGCNKGQLERFQKQIQYTMDCTMRHQEYISSGDLPASRLEYWSTRLGDSFTFTFWAINEYIIIRPPIPIFLVAKRM